MQEETDTPDTWFFPFEADTRDLFDVPNIALIPPVPDAHWTASMKFHLCEAPIVLTDDSYAKCYHWHKVEKGHYVIIDNGAAIGRTVSDEHLVKAAHLVDADEIVVPDEMANREVTYGRAKVFLKSYALEFDTMMFVPQGVSFESWYASLSELVQLAHDYRVKRVIIGIGKHMHSRIKGGRGELIGQCAMMGLTCHLLGASDEPLEDLRLLDVPCVRGYDTSLPFTLAQQGITLLKEPTLEKWCEPKLSGKRPKLSFFETSWPVGHVNMERFLTWVYERRTANRP